MLVIMNNDASANDVARVQNAIADLGFEARLIPGRTRTAIGVLGNDRPIDSARFQNLPGVLEIVHITRPYKLVSREWQPEPTIVRVRPDVSFGGKRIPIIAGPCSVESEEQIMQAARAVRAGGGAMLRGGAFKPRSSPYSFQGLGVRGLELLAAAREETGLPVVTEALEPDTVDTVAEYADMIQVGSRNMQNFPLLKRVGRSGKPVLLKRGMSATISELLLSAEYILAEGNPNVVLCERGVRGFDGHTRNLLDLTAIPVIQKLSHLPIIADPSHGTGVRGLVAPMARAAVAAGSDGLMVEVHPDPASALSDGAQSISPAEFDILMAELEDVARATDRHVAVGQGEAIGA